MDMRSLMVVIPESEVYLMSKKKANEERESIQIAPMAIFSAYYIVAIIIVIIIKSILI